MTQIRSLDENDYDTLLDLWQRAGLSSLRPQGRDSRAAFRRQLADGQIALGLEEAGRLLGVVLATHDTRKGWINRLAVDPDHRRRGFGRLLQRAAEEELRRRGMQVIGVLIERWNETSLAMFREDGYELHDDIAYLVKKTSPEA
jgi:ribosomal protein S18 acetylase RimI-like enzyme